jgi:hypothetical protein
MFDAGHDEFAAVPFEEDGARLQRLDADADERACDDGVREDLVEIRGEVCGGWRTLPAGPDCLGISKLWVGRRNIRRVRQYKT